MCPTYHVARGVIDEGSDLPVLCGTTSMLVDHSVVLGHMRNKTNGRRSHCRDCQGHSFPYSLSATSQYDSGVLDWGIDKRTLIQRIESLDDEINHQGGLLTE